MILHLCIVHTGGEDYEVPLNQYKKVILPAGSTSVSIDITIFNDIMFEYNETFRMIILELSIPYGIYPGSLTSTTITILDDDSKHTYAYTTY